MSLRKFDGPPLRWACLLLLLAAGALAVGALAVETSAAPAPAKPSQHDWKNVTLLYLSDIKGKIEPCG
jgi:hypothetical protein